LFATIMLYRHIFDSETDPKSSVCARLQRLVFQIVIYIYRRHRNTEGEIVDIQLLRVLNHN